MTLALLCTHQVTLLRAVQSPGPNGEVVRQWQTQVAQIPAAVLAFRARPENTFLRRGMAVTHVVLTPQNIGALLGDRLFDGNLYYLVHFVANLGDRGRSWAVYCQLHEPQDPAS